MRSELARTSHSAQVSCAGLSAALHSREGGAALTLEREKVLRVQLEQQLRERVSEMMNFQTRADAERSELNVRSLTLFNPTELLLDKLLLFVNDYYCVNYQIVRFRERRGKTQELD